MVCDQILVFFKTGTSITTIQVSISKIGGTVIGVLSYPGRNAWQVSIPCTTASGVLSAVAALEADPNTEGATPNTISSSHAVVNDPQYPNQWSLTKIQADLAWLAAPIGIGLPSANPHPKMIGIVDSGIWYPHEDLHGKVLLGHNWVDGNSVPLDDFAHGTHVAGIASAFSNNNIGIAGVMSAQWLLAEKVLDSTGHGASTGISRGIKDAVDQGAQVINLSLILPSRDEGVAAAIDYANQAGRIVVVAAGNNNCGDKSYPAAFGDGETFSHLFGLIVHVYNAHVLAVGATDQSDVRSIWSSGQSQCTPNTGSNFGAWVVVYAPGTSILSTVPNNGYQYLDGTSMAAPHVTGAAAYVWSMNPSLNADQVRNVIISTADDTGANDPAGNRIHRLNVFNALRSTQTTVTYQFTGQYIDNGVTGHKATVSLQYTSSGFITAQTPPLFPNNLDFCTTTSPGQSCCIVYFSPVFPGVPPGTVVSAVTVNISNTDHTANYQTNYIFPSGTFSNTGTFTSPGEWLWSGYFESFGAVEILRCHVMLPSRPCKIKSVILHKTR